MWRSGWNESQAFVLTAFTWFLPRDFLLVVYNLGAFLLWGKPILIAQISFSWIFMSLILRNAWGAPATILLVDLCPDTFYYHYYCYFCIVRNIADSALFHSASRCWCCDPLGHPEVTVCLQTWLLAPPSDCGLISPRTGADTLALTSERRLASAPVLVPLPSGRWIPNYSGEIAVAIELKCSFLKSKEMKTTQYLLVSDLPT